MCVAQGLHTPVCSETPAADTCISLLEGPPRVQVVHRSWEWTSPKNSPQAKTNACWETMLKFILPTVSLGSPRLSSTCTQVTTLITPSLFYLLFSTSLHFSPVDFPREKKKKKLYELQSCLRLCFCGVQTKIEVKSDPETKRRHLLHAVTLLNVSGWFQ